MRSRALLALIFIIFVIRDIAAAVFNGFGGFVDFFVVVEANITHQGKKKDWNFQNMLKNNLKEFSNKIQYHQINIDPEKIKNEEGWIVGDIKGDDAWRIENFQRN